MTNTNPSVKSKLISVTAFAIVFGAIAALMHAVGWANSSEWMPSWLSATVAAVLVAWATFSFADRAKRALRVIVAVFVVPGWAAIAVSTLGITELWSVALVAAVIGTSLSMFIVWATSPELKLFAFIFITVGVWISNYMFGHDINAFLSAQSTLVYSLFFAGVGAFSASITHFLLNDRA